MILEEKIEILEEKIKILERKIEILEEKIKILERKIEYLEGIECIGCKKKYADTDELPLCDICEHPVCYSCIQEGPGCPRKICAIIYQMLKDTKTD